MLEHSERTHGFLALQQYKVDGQQQVAFAVGDSGVGLRTTLARSNRCPDDAAAIDLAVQRRVSSKGPDAGLGINSVAGIACARDGNLRLWSGQAFGIVTSPAGAGSKRSPKGHMHGTVVHARMRVR